MPRIDDRAATIFKEASITVLDCFTVGELADLKIEAEKVNAIIKCAEQREQDKLA